MSDEYLEPGFDHKSLKVAELRLILTENNISFPSTAKKAELRHIYNTKIIPMLPRLRGSDNAGESGTEGSDSAGSASTVPEDSASPPHKRGRDEMEGSESSEGSDSDVHSNSASVSNARKISLSSSSDDDENMSSDSSLSNVVTKGPSTPSPKKRKTTGSVSGTPIISRVQNKSQRYENKSKADFASLGLSSQSEDDSDDSMSLSDSESISNIQKTRKENVAPKSFDFSVQSKTITPDLKKMRVSSGFADQLRKAVESNSGVVSSPETSKAKSGDVSAANLSTHDTLGIKLSGPPLQFDKLIEISDSSDDNDYDKLVEKISSQNPATGNTRTKVPTPPVVSEEDVRQAEERERALQEDIQTNSRVVDYDEPDKLESVPPVDINASHNSSMTRPTSFETAIASHHENETPHEHPHEEKPIDNHSAVDDEREEVESEDESSSETNQNQNDDGEYDLDETAGISVNHESIDGDDNVIVSDVDDNVILDDVDHNDSPAPSETHREETEKDIVHDVIDLDESKKSSPEPVKESITPQGEASKEEVVTDDSKVPNTKKERTIIFSVTKALFKFILVATAFILGLSALLFALWYREQIVSVGYCGYEKKGTSIYDIHPNFTILRKVDDILEQYTPSCIPCPDHSICYPYMKLRCKPGYTIQKAKFGLFGLLPMSDSCVKDDKRSQLVKEVVKKSLEFLRTKNAQVACGDSEDNISSGISQEDLHNIFSEARAPWIDDEEYEKIWIQVLQDLQTEPEIIMRQVSINDFIFTFLK